MRRGKGVLFLSAVLFFLGTAEYSWAQPLKLTVSQKNIPVELTVGQIDLTGAGGSDIGESETAVDEKTLDLTNTNGSWRIDISKVDTLWDPNIHIFIRRTGDGDGTGPFLGGLVYQEITDIDITFFSGIGDSTNIPLQFKYGGNYATLGVATGLYTTTITYTVTDNL